MTVFTVTFSTVLRLSCCASALLVSMLFSDMALAAGKPHPTYPETLSAPESEAARVEECASLRESVQASQASMAKQGILARLDFIRVRHRAAERFLQDHCGEVTDNGLELSHRQEASGKVVGSTPESAAHH